MLNESTVFATIAVGDISSAKQFYGETLGLKQTDESPAGVTYTSGTGKLLIYQAATAGKGEATCASWDVSDVDAVAADLKTKGIQFEHYDMPGATLEGDIHVLGPLHAAWFKDPDGNILAFGSDK